MKALFKLFFLLLALLLSVTFTALNPGTVEVNLYSVKLELPLAALVVCALFLGMLLGYLSAFGKRLASRREQKRLKKCLDSAETELNNLRKAPIRGGD